MWNSPGEYVGAWSRSLNFRTMKTCSLVLLVTSICAPLTFGGESLPPLKDGKSPQTVEEAWAGYDPSVEPLEVAVIKEWKKEGVVLRAVRYRIGVFKGQKSWMGALFGFPEGANDLPGIVQIHGGGGMASEQMCIDNAKRGYATVSLSWRADERYLTTYELPEEAQTDWGAVEGRQVNGTRDVKSESEKHYDPVPSARNHGYFLRALAARRALTFLEQQPEVDGDRLGVDGFSMGGVITLMTAAMDSRVKAAAPWWAPPLVLDGSLLGRTASPNAYAEHIKGSMLLMAPSNDFHGKAEDVAWMMDHIPSEDVRIARSVHLNHKNDAQSMAARELWFDARLKDGFSFPGQPEISVDLTSKEKRPVVCIVPDESTPVARVDVYYTRDAKESEHATNRTRYWQHVRPDQGEGKYMAHLDLFDVEEPMWVFANVVYEVPNSKKGSPLTKPSDVFTVSTRMIMKSVDQLAEAGLQMDDETTQVIESFKPGWEGNWLVSGNRWESWKLNDARVPLPEYGKLVIEVQSSEANRLSVDIGGYRGDFNLEGGSDPQRIEVDPFDLKDKATKARLLNWSALKRPMISLSTSRSKPQPSFKKLLWENVPKEEFMTKRPFQLGEAADDDGRVPLTFELADLVVGRFDADAESVRVDEAFSEIDVKEGLQVHSQGQSEVTYFLKGGFSSFSATLVPCFQASVTFEVHGDGKKLFESERFTGKTAPEEIAVDVSGVQELKLIVTEGGNGWGGDWVLWGKARCE